MEFVYTFNLKKVEYDCVKCGGLCCNINGFLQFTREQLENTNIFSEVSDFFWKTETSLYNCKTPKKCWFLKDQSCILPQESKPYCCSLYPLKLWRFNAETIIVSIIPCATMQYTLGISHDFDNIEVLANKFCQEIKINEGYFAENILDKKEDEIVVLNKYINKLQSMMNYNDILEDIFLQFAIEPIIYNVLDDVDINQIFNKYQEHLAKIRKSKIITNQQNIYILMHNFISKYVLFNYYEPIFAGEKQEKKCCINHIDTSYNSLYNDRQIKWKRKK